MAWRNKKTSSFILPSRDKGSQTPNCLRTTINSPTTTAMANISIPSKPIVDLLYIYSIYITSENFILDKTKWKHLRSLSSPKLMMRAAPHTSPAVCHLHPSASFNSPDACICTSISNYDLNCRAAKKKKKVECRASSLTSPTEFSSMSSKVISTAVHLSSIVSHPGSLLSCYIWVWWCGRF